MSGPACLGACLALTLLGAAPAGLAEASESPAPWGRKGHEVAARAALGALPAGMPAFFASAGDQLVFLDPEPDRWRDFSFREMDQAWRYDHYIDFENVPADALAARDRFRYLKALTESGLTDPVAEGGFLPFRIVELYQRMVIGWNAWRSETDPRRKAWIEARIINDAGILGHYVTDGSQPHHTTIHFNGWDDSTPNPNGYTDDRTFHARFESDFIDAHVTPAEVMRRTAPARSVAGSARADVLTYLEQTHTMVETLYRLDRDVSFDPGRPASSEARDFAVERLAAGASMLATLWWSAWEESAR